MQKPKIQITQDGPYIVTGNVPLYEKFIVPIGKKYELQEGKELPQSETYALCRCGKSKNPPFCDGSHEKVSFVGTETASKAKYEERAEMIEGPEIDLLDDNRCAFSRFCHRENGNVWQLTRKSHLGSNRGEAIIAASECLAGRLVAVDKDGNVIESEHRPSINIIQDPEKKVSAGIFVKGNIPIEGADDEIYEVRNRVTLCRCGNSGNKPFCDAAHVAIEFKDK